MKLLLSLTAAAVLASGAAIAEEVSVTIDGVQQGPGSVLVALQTEDQFLAKEGEYTETVTADSESVEVMFQDVEPGTYAVAVVHDEDGDGDFTVGDTGPMEGWGLSGGMMAGAPEFASSSIEVMEGETTEASVTMSYPM
ncbi:DUF2141 domain-containing protein [Acuticoccus sp.]|uniref:DUF2141 domain-containing protein n=1 Tax=Acuticoccus sp. TaxID=1904378 RepID=UPI003B523733